MYVLKLRSVKVSCPKRMEYKTFNGSCKSLLIWPVKRFMKIMPKI